VCQDGADPQVESRLFRMMAGVLERMAGHRLANLGAFKGKTKGAWTIKNCIHIGKPREWFLKNSRQNY